VWLGRDDSKPIGDAITGGTFAAPIWLDFMKAAHPDTPIRDFDVPPGVTFVRADEDSGDPAGPSNDAVWVPFAHGNLPASFGGGKAPASFTEMVPPPPLPTGK
jgi:penicillin-binding protein 1A